MSKTILYLEDDEALASVTVRALQKRGFVVEYHGSTASFRRVLTRVEFAYALLDLKIGNETSLGLIREIKTIKDVPIVVLTGYGTIRTAVQAMKLGAINFLSKPCGIDEIIASLQEAATDEPLDVLPLEKPSLKAIEWETIQQALDENGGNISAAARQLKMHRRTLQRKLNKRHIELPGGSV